jgi:RimJ/RimL family protein N-acetyltransferase
MIRPALEADLNSLVDLTWDVAAEGQWIGAEVPFDREDRKELYADLLRAGDSTVLVADATSTGGPSMVGQISVSVARYGVADIGMMLANGWRGQGLGRALLDGAIAWAEAAKAHKVWLEVWPHNTAAIGLYRRAGFVEEGRKLRHYRRRNGELWDALLMGLPLPSNDG